MRPPSTFLKALPLLALVAAVLLWPRLGPVSPASAATVVIPVGDIWFCDPTYANGASCDTTIHAGDTVVWDFSGAQEPHTTTECGPSCPPAGGYVPVWDSGFVAGGSTTRFEHVFTQAGTYNYYCGIHGTAQRGRIIVQTEATPVPTPPGQAGDANKDGTVNSIDAALVLQRTAGLLPSINPNADVNGDGRIDSIDAALILQFVAGLIPRLPP